MDNDYIDDKNDINNDYDNDNHNKIDYNNYVSIKDAVNSDDDIDEKFYIYDNIDIDNDYANDDIIKDNDINDDNFSKEASQLPDCQILKKFIFIWIKGANIPGKPKKSERHIIQNRRYPFLCLISVRM